MENFNQQTFSIAVSQFSASFDHSLFAVKKLRRGIVVAALFALLCITTAAIMIYLHLGFVPGPLIIAGVVLVGAVAKLQVRGENAR